MPTILLFPGTTEKLLGLKTDRCKSKIQVLQANVIPTTPVLWCFVSGTSINLGKRKPSRLCHDQAYHYHSADIFKCIFSHHSHHRCNMDCFTERKLWLYPTVNSYVFYSVWEYVQSWRGNLPQVISLSALARFVLTFSSCILMSWVIRKETCPEKT